jgi:hypothetical protein
MICDDVRREDNGKEIIIGVYSETIIVESFPVLLATFAVRFVIRVPIKRPLTLDGSIAGPDGVDIVKFQGELRAEREETYNAFSFKMSPLVLRAPGMHSIRAGIETKPRSVYSFNAVTREQFAPKPT